jgi:hypothetical protein
MWMEEKSKVSKHIVQEGRELKTVNRMTVILYTRLRKR